MGLSTEPLATLSHIPFSLLKVVTLFMFTILGA